VVAVLDAGDRPSFQALLPCVGTTMRNCQASSVAGRDKRLSGWNRSISLEVKLILNTLAAVS